jgi:hypothetical protein
MGFTDPVLARQAKFLPLAARADPAITPTEVTSLDGYESVHWSPARERSLAAVNVRFKEMAPPLPTDPESRLTDGASAWARLLDESAEMRSEMRRVRLFVRKIDILRAPIVAKLLVDLKVLR